MLPLPAFVFLLTMMAPITQSQGTGILPMFNLMKFWNCYMELMKNPMAAMMDPTKAMNSMMCGWEVPKNESPTLPLPPPKTDETAPKPATASSRQGNARIDISPEAALALAVFRKGHQMNGGEDRNFATAAAGSSVDRSAFPAGFSHIPPVASQRSMPIMEGLPTILGGGGGLYSPLVSQPYFYVLPTKGRKSDDSSSNEDTEPMKPRPAVVPGPMIITSQPFPPPFGGTFRPQGPFGPRPQVIMAGRPHSHKHIVVNQRGDSESSESISVIQR